jgi:hypothetical protein
MKTFSILTLALLLTACSALPPGISPPAPTAPVATATNGPIVITAVSSTVVAITALPDDTTPQPFPTAEPATPIPTLSSGAASPTELKYNVLDEFPKLFFCDPDYYPVARADEADLARQKFPELQANQEEFQAILKHNGLSGVSTFSDDQKLLIYREHKKLAAIHFELSGNGYQFQLQTADNEVEGFSIQGFIDGGGTITVQKRDTAFVTCPICLAAHTQIDTPTGSVAVEELRVGDVVWTMDATGARVAAPILKIARVPVPAKHPMVHVILDDGRELWASPGHPTTTGQALGDLQVGDRLDEVHVTRVERVPYDQPETYDLLPSGETGFYWANGILIGSTLAEP